MWRRWFFLLLIVSGLLWAPCAPAASRLDGLSGDCELLKGVLALDLAETLDPPAQEWVVADVAPGEWRVPADLNLTLPSGRSAGGPNGGIITRILGRLIVRRRLTTVQLPGVPIIRTESYDWTQDGRLGWPAYGGPVAPFIVGGVTVCRVHADRQGAARYDSASLIPPAWSPDLVAAFGYCRSHAALFRAPAPGAAPPPDTLSHLRALLADRNPFLVAQAVRSLAALRGSPGASAVSGQTASGLPVGQAARIPGLAGPDAGTLARQVAEARGLRQALLMLLLLRYASPSDDEAAKAVLLGVLQTATDARQVVGIELGCYVRYDIGVGLRMEHFQGVRTEPAQSTAPERLDFDPMEVLGGPLVAEKTALADGVPVTGIYPKVGSLTDGISRADAYKYVALIVDHEGF